MEPSLLKYVWRHSKRDQIVILLVVLASLPFYFISLDLPKRIVNEAIQGKAFQQGKATIIAFATSIELPAFLGGGKLTLFEGMELDRLGYLLGLSFMLFALVMINGAFKYKINISKGVIGERMLRRMRYDLFHQLLRFRPEEVRLLKPSEAASIIKDEVEPIGGFIGDAFIQPAFLITQAGTALFFIVVQNFWLGILTVVTVAIQAAIVPALRKKQLLLGKERQIASRKLAGKVGELVEGMQAVRTHGTQSYESAEIAGRLGNLFRIRFDLFKRKFAVKYLNNLLAQLTPFLFYTIGGYFALKGTLDVGQLIAVIAAYKDIPPPVKELIDWDQQRNDVTIKYEQVVEQFSPAAPVVPEPSPKQPLVINGAKLVVDGLTVADGRGAALLEGASVHIDLPAHVAMFGHTGSGREAFARALGRQITRYDGTLKISEHSLLTLDPATATSIVAYASSEPALFSTSIRENVLYGLKTEIPAVDENTHDLAERKRQDEARRSGNSIYRPEDNWIHFASAEASDMETLDTRIIDALKTVGLGDDVYRFGLSAKIEPERDASLAAELVKARQFIRERLIAEDKTRLIEPFDPERYNSNASVGENLLFGVSVAAGISDAALISNTGTRSVLAAHGLIIPLAGIGVQIAETMLEIFVGLPPGHPLFERYSFISSADLPEYEDIVGRWRNNGKNVEKLSSGIERLAVLALGYVEPRHRLGMLNDELKAKIVEARHALHAVWRKDGSNDVEIYHPDRYCIAAPIRDNLLFGRVGFGIAGANEAIADLLRTALAELSLESSIYRIGLDFQCGPGGKLLFATQRTGIDLARCLLRRPEILVIDGALSGYRPVDALAMVQRLKSNAEGRSLFVDMPDDAPTDGFDLAITFENGRITGATSPTASPAPKGE